MSRAQQRKGAQGEQELTFILRRAGYPVQWGGNKTYGEVPDVSGLPGIHIECKRVERLNLSRAMEQAQRDAARFRDGAPAFFHRRNRSPWLVTMQLTDWLQLYAQRDRDPHAHFLINHNKDFGKEPTMPQKIHFWEDEKPVTADTEKNHFEYYRNAHKLSVGNLTGRTRPGRLSGARLCSLIWTL